MYTPVIDFNHEVPAINQERGRDVDTSGLKPRKLTQDIWFHVEQLGLIGRVIEKKTLLECFQVTLDNDMVFIVKDTTIVRGRYMKRSLNGKTFGFDNVDDVSRISF